MEDNYKNLKNFNLSRKNKHHKSIRKKEKEKKKISVYYKCKQQRLSSLNVYVMDDFVV